MRGAEPSIGEGLRNSSGFVCDRLSRRNCRAAIRTAVPLLLRAPRRSRTWAAALRGEHVLEWVRGGCIRGEWTAGRDEAEVADVHVEVQRQHGEVTRAELRDALGEAEDEGAVLVRGTTVPFI